jgi:uncharacterized membrane protein
LPRKSKTKSFWRLRRQTAHRSIAMMVIYTYLYLAPWQRFRRAVSTADWPAAHKHIGQIRPLVGLNLVLGLVTVVIGASGRYYH